jgi:hypothetical protein
MTEEDTEERQKKMMGKDRKKPWVRTEEDAREGQKKMLEEDRRRC